MKDFFILKPIPAFTTPRLGAGGLEEQYYFHPDHLGSSNYITNIAGDVSQHMEYFAFGETFVEEHKNSINSPFKFNGKELDEESGLYYYGARYYDPRLSIWASVDPLADYNPHMNDEHYIDGEHNDGIYNHFNHNSYGYCYQSPVRYVDPNGKQTDTTDKALLLTTTTNTAARTTATEVTGSYVDDAGKLVLDGVKSNPTNFLKAAGIGLLCTAILKTFCSGQSQEEVDMLDRINRQAKGDFSTTSHYSSTSASGFDVQDLKDLRNKSRNKSPDGSYTITFENGKKYHGKGPVGRMAKSALIFLAKFSLFGVKNDIINLDWTPARTTRQAFKDEHTRMQKDKNVNAGIPQGYDSPKNYNINQSPGYNFKKQDGQSTD